MDNNDPASPASAPARARKGAVARLAGRVRHALKLGRGARGSDVQGPALHGEGAVDVPAQERNLLRNVLSLRQTRIEDVMVPRADIIAVPGDITLAALLEVFREAGHSRLPVYGETLDEPKGMVHIRDFMDYLATKVRRGRGRRKPQEGEAASLAGVDLGTRLDTLKILRPVLYVPASMRAVTLLRRMQATRTHMALVIDEYGGTDGLVSIENLIEILVGDIEDEHDEEEGALVSRVDDRTLVASARAELSEVSAMLGTDLSLGHAAEEVDTLGGLIVTLAGRVPARGELIAGPGNIEFEVMEADPRRVKRVRIHLRSGEAERPRVVTPPALPVEAPASPPEATRASGPRGPVTEPDGQ
jgi:CBS domain containing-hemolysin-like protein